MRNNANDHHLRLFFTAGARAAAGTVATISLVATPNAACTDPATPAPLTVAWNLTLANTSGWVNQGRDSATASSAFSALTLTAAHRQDRDRPGVPPKRRRLPPDRRRADQHAAELRRAGPLPGQRHHRGHRLEQHLHAQGPDRRPAPAAVLQAARRRRRRQHRDRLGGRDPERLVHRSADAGAADAGVEPDAGGPGAVDRPGPRRPGLQRAVLAAAPRRRRDRPRVSTKARPPAAASTSRSSAARRATSSSSATPAARPRTTRR